MQTHLLVGPTPIKGCRRFSSAISGDLLPPSFNSCGRESRDLYHHRRRHREGRSRWQRSRQKTTVISAASSSSWASASNTGGQNHYVVLGIARNATQADVKRAYRLLARKVRTLVWDSSRYLVWHNWFDWLIWLKMSVLQLVSSGNKKARILCVLYE